MIRNTTPVQPPKAPPAQTTEAVKPRPRKSIERHLDRFFDLDRDRKITTFETYRGIRRLGLGRPASTAVALGINIGLGLKTGGGLLTIDLNNIPAGKHAGDSGVLDANGEFNQVAFDAIFDQHAKTYPDALTEAEMSAFRHANHARDDKAGPTDFVAGLGEFGLLFAMAGQDRDGTKVLTRERLNEFYNGDLFDTLAKENAAKRDERSKTLVGTLKNFVRDWTI